MAHFVIAGKPNCPHFNHTILVGEYLSDHLPDFTLKKIQLEKGKWEPFLLKQNELNGWYHTCSPIIWKELNKRNGKPHLIGGISDFWEYCYDYYGLQSILSEEVINIIVEKNVQLFRTMQEMEQKKVTFTRNIIIYGATNEMVPILLPELNNIEGLKLQLGVHIYLFENYISEEKEEYLKDLVDDYKGIGNNISIAERLEDILPFCDLIIFTEDTSQQDDEDIDSYLIRNLYQMRQLAVSINSQGLRSLRIVLANRGPICYNANTLLRAGNVVLRSGNVVAVSADRGSIYLNIVAKRYNLAIESVGAPPVYGSIGVNEYVDVDGAFYVSDMRRPYGRALRLPSEGSALSRGSLPLGTTRRELRYLCHMTHEGGGGGGSGGGPLESIVKNREKYYVRRMKRAPVLPRVTATINLLRLWYGRNPSDEIISLGVPSNGSFDIPNGLVFSQPVCLEGDTWTPVGNFPLLKQTKEKIASLIPEAVRLFEDYVLLNTKTSGFINCAARDDKEGDFGLSYGE